MAEQATFNRKVLGPNPSGPTLLICQPVPAELAPVAYFFSQTPSK